MKITVKNQVSLGPFPLFLVSCPFVWHSIFPLYSGCISISETEHFSPHPTTKKEQENAQFDLQTVCFGIQKNAAVIPVNESLPFIDTRDLRTLVYLPCGLSGYSMVHGRFNSKEFP